MSLFSQSWVEKYRPQTMDQICSQEHIINILLKSIENTTIPHLLFYGPPGTGKTSTIMALAKTIYKDNINDNVMGLNASDERGIGVVRNKIKAFAQTSISVKEGMPSFKLIVLDEADSMTCDAQAALRRIIEDYSHITRFCMICNYVSRMIDPLISRCFKFYFKPITNNNIRSRLQFISDAESCNIKPEVFDTIIEVVSGDLRRAISIMEVSYRVHGHNIEKKHIEDYAGHCPTNVLQPIIKYIRSDNKLDMATIHNYAISILKKGYPVWSILNQLQDYIINENYPEEIKANICWKISNITMALQDGTDEYIQLVYTIGYIIKTLSR